MGLGHKKSEYIGGVKLRYTLLIRHLKRAKITWNFHVFTVGRLILTWSERFKITWLVLKAVLRNTGVDAPKVYDVGRILWKYERPPARGD